MRPARAKSRSRVATTQPTNGTKTMKLSRITAFAIATLIGVSAIGAPAHANIFGKVLGIPNLGGIQHAKPKPSRPNPMEVRGNCMQKAKVDKEYSMLLLKHSK